MTNEPNRLNKLEVEQQPRLAVIPGWNYKDHLGIILTSHPRQQKFMDIGISSLDGYEGFVLLGYDSDSTDSLPLDRWLKPNGPIDEVFTTGAPNGSGHVRGELLQMKRGGEILAERGFTHFYKSAADTTCYRHYGFERLYKLLCNAKVHIVHAGTAQLFGELGAYNKIMEPYHAHFRCGAAENYFAKTARKTGIRTYDLPRDGRHFASWENILGRIHVQGEWAISRGIRVADTWDVGEIWKH